MSVSFKIAGMNKAVIKTSTSPLPRKATFCRKVLEVLAEHDGLSTRQITLILLGNPLDDKILQLRQWHKILYENGEGNAYLYKHRSHYYKCKEWIRYSYAGKTKRAMDVLIKKGLVKRKDILFPQGHPCNIIYTSAAIYTIMPLGMEALNTLRLMERCKLATPWPEASNRVLAEVAEYPPNFHKPLQLVLC